MLTRPVLLVIAALGVGSCAPGRTPTGLGPSRSAGDVPPSVSAQNSRTSSPTRNRPALPENPALADYLAAAALNNPGLKAAYHRWRAALQRGPQARSLPNPTISYGYYIREVETRVGAQHNRLEVAQKLPWPGKLSAAEAAASEQARAAEAKYRAEKLALFGKVRSAYADYYYLARAVEVASENLRLLEHVQDVVRARYAAAGASRTDLARLEVETGRLDERLRSLRLQLPAAAARLAAATGLGRIANLPPPTALPGGEARFSDDQLATWARQSNPNLAALEAGIAEADEKVRLAQQQYYPDARLGLSWIQTARGVGASPPFDDGKDPLVAMLSVDLPIWREKLAAGVSEARHRRREARRRYEQFRLDLEARLAETAFAYRDANQKVELYRRLLLPRAREAMKVTQTAYRAGTSGFADLIDAQRVLLEFRLTEHRARADRVIHLAELEALAGRELPGPATTRPAPAETGAPDLAE